MSNLDVNKFNSGRDQKLKVHKNSLINSPISSRKAGHVVPIPFLVLGIRVVTIVAAQSLQLGMVF